MSAYLSDSILLNEMCKGSKRVKNMNFLHFHVRFARIWQRQHRGEREKAGLMEANQSL